MEILDYERKGEKMNVKEDLHIFLNLKENPNCIVNKMHITNRNPIFKEISKLRADNFTT